MDEIFNKSILYDLYGGLLSKNQQIVYEYHVSDDLSFTEIGEELHISRQAAYDLFKNADKKLKEIDTKLELSVRFKDIQKLANEIKVKANDDKQIIALSNKIIKKTLKGGKD
ncbi:MAG: transcriptional regulator [Lachnospiraceae bacterium]|nr:transcriptional regulator [Lachnospiraceae bacterium]